MPCHRHLVPSFPLLALPLLALPLLALACSGRPLPSVVHPEARASEPNSSRTELEPLPEAREAPLVRSDPTADAKRPGWEELPAERSAVEIAPVPGARIHGVLEWPRQEGPPENPDWNEVELEVVDGAGFTPAEDDWMKPVDARPREDGGYLIEGLPSDRPLRLIVRAPGLPGRTVELGRLAPEEDRRVDVTLLPGVRLSGALFATDGGEVGGIRVVARPPGSHAWNSRAYWALTDGEGRFEIENAPAGRLVLRADVPRSASLQIDAQPGERLTELTLGVCAGKTLRGSVRWWDGMPARNTPVMVQDPRGRTKGTKTDDDGEFVFGNMTDEPCRLIAGGVGIDELAGYARLEGIVAGSAEYQVVLERRPALEVRVVDASGCPIAAARVATYGTLDDAETETDEAGLAVLPLPAPSAMIEVFAEGFLERDLFGIRAEERDEPLLIVLDHRRDAAVHGVVLDPRGRPVPGARLYCDRGHDETDGHGRFDLVGLRPGEAWLDVEAAGYSPASLWLALDGGQVIEGYTIRIPARADLIGRLLDEDGHPVPGVDVELTATSREEYSGVTTDASGRFEVRGLRIERYEVSASLTLPDAWPATVFQELDVREGTTHELVLRLSPPDPICVSGRLTRNGRPVGGKCDWRAQRDPEMPDVSSSCDDSGRFEVVLPRPGPYEIWFEVDGEWRAHQVEVHHGDVLQVAFELLSEEEN